MSHCGATAGLAGSMEQRGKRTSLALLIVVSVFLIVLFSFRFFSSFSLVSSARRCARFRLLKTKTEKMNYERYAANKKWRQQIHDTNFSRSKDMAEGKKNYNFKVNARFMAVNGGAMGNNRRRCRRRLYLSLCVGARSSELSDSFNLNPSQIWLFRFFGKWQQEIERQRQLPSVKLMMLFFSYKFVIALFYYNHPKKSFFNLFYAFNFHVIGLAQFFILFLLHFNLTLGRGMMCVRHQSSASNDTNDPALTTVPNTAAAYHSAGYRWFRWWWWHYGCPIKIKKNPRQRKQTQNDDGEENVCTHSNFYEFMSIVCSDDGA